MRIQDIQSAEAELSFRSWGLGLCSQKTRRSFVMSFLEAVEVAGDESELKSEFNRRSRERVSPVIWFLLAELALKILIEWWKTRDPNA